MQNTIADKLKEVAKFCREEPGQVIAQALDIGLEKLWVDTVLAQYLKKQISRRKAVHLVGVDYVKLAERQDKIARNDLKWGLRRGPIGH